MEISTANVLKQWTTSYRILEKVAPVTFQFFTGAIEKVMKIYVTGFAKTLHVCTRIEIHFIAYYNSHTRALSRHNSKTGIDE